MTLTVGNLLTDPLAQSFISLADADAYLAPEQQAGWDARRSDEQEAALVRASRWLVSTYRFRPLAEPDLVRVGHVAARLAAETAGESLFAGQDTNAIVESEKVGPIAVTYATGQRADAAGMSWGWLEPMLSGLIRKHDGMGALVV